MMSNEMKHTPGPWEAQHSGTGDATVIATCGWKHKDGSEFNPTIVPRADWPDALLIAAAPDLLEAAREFLRVLDALREVNVLGEWPVVRESIQPLRAAIVKAGGARAKK